MKTPQLPDDASAETRVDGATSHAEQAAQIAQLRAELAAERRIAELARDFLNLDTSELGKEIVSALGSAARSTGADSAQFVALLQARDIRSRPALERHWWDADSTHAPQMPNASDIQGCRWSQERLSAGEVIHAPDVALMPDEARHERELLLARGARSFLAIPILATGLAGYLDFRCTRIARHWEADEIERLRLLGEVLSSVAQRSYAESAYRASAERFRAMAENLRDTLIESTPEGKILYASPSVRDLLGYSPDEFRALEPSEVLHSETQLNGLQYWIEAEDTNARRTIELRGLHRDGSERKIEAIAKRYSTASGRSRIVTMLRDVTAERALRADLEQRLELETLISDLSRRFLSADADEIDELIEDGLRRAAEIGGADRAWLLELPAHKGGESTYFEYAMPEIGRRVVPPSEADRLRYPEVAGRLMRGELVQVPVVAELPDEQGAVRERMLARGVLSYLLLPVLARGRLVSILGLHCTREERSWPDHEIALLRMMAELFVIALRRKRSQSALAASEERFRALAENSRDSICELSDSGEILYASPAYAELVGTRPEDLEGLNALELAHVDDRDHVGAGLEDALIGDWAGRIVFRTQHHDGSWLHIEASASRFQVASGERRLVVVLRDVTEREHSRAALELQLEREKQVAELSRFFLDLEASSIEDAIREKLADAASVAGAEHSWMYTIDPRNPESPRLYEWWDEALAERAPAAPIAQIRDFDWSIGQLLKDKELNVASARELPAEASKEAADMRARGVRSMLLIPLLYEKRFIGAMGFETMTREQSWPAETITLLRLVGEIFVSALRRELSEIELQSSRNQLVQSQKMEAIGTLAGGIAHDFNNHLAVMLGNVRYVLSETDEGSEENEALLDLQRSAEHCAELTRSLLEFSRRSPFRTQIIDVGQALGHVTELVRPLLPKTIALVVRCESHGAVRTDPTQFRQVLINLLVNARDAMKTGGTLTVCARDCEINREEAARLDLAHAGEYIEISVDDEGEGMSPETLARIFEPFFTTKEIGKGTGLGLATGYGIVQQCGGAITADSTLGQGSHFRVLLPRLDNPIAPDPAPPEPLPLPGSETLLLAEDEPAVRRVIARTLRARGYRVIEAEDGLEALSLAEEARDDLDLLVSDLVMPHMGGIELASKLRATMPNLPVLLLSGHTEPRDPAAREALRGSRFLQKPFADEALLDEVRSLLDR